MQKTTRQSGIELLRIICMLSIIVLHAYSYGGIADISNQYGGAFKDTSNFIWSFFRTPVNVFVIITGYFMSKDVLDFKKSYRRIPKVYLTMLFYSILCTIASIIIFNSRGSIIMNNATENIDVQTTFEKYSMEKLTGNNLIYTIIRMFFPFFSSEWYFLTNYIIILLFSPFINYLINGIDKKHFRIFLGLLFVFLSIWPTLSSMGGFKNIFSMTKVIPLEYGKSLISFIFMYIIGAYLKRFSKDDEKLHVKYLIYFVVLCIIDFSLWYFLHNVKLNGTGIYAGAVFGQFSNPFVILESIFIFLFFRGINFRSRVVNFIAGTTIGIYAIHENHLLRSYIWSYNCFDNPGFYNNLSGILIMILTILIIFVVCSLIDTARQGIFKGGEILFNKIKLKIQKEKSE